MTPGIHELRDDELDEVSGGLVVIAIIAILIGQLIPS
jgi:bacteriocin-like protein